MMECEKEWVCEYVCFVLMCEKMKSCDVLCVLIMLYMVMMNLDMLTPSRWR